jgi:molecular chaperone DnaJ
VLADPQKRAAYDRFGHAGVGAGAGGAGFDPTIFADFGDILGGLGDIFGFGDAFGGRGRSGRGADLRYDLEVSFEEAAKGTETRIQIPRDETCETCRGSGAAAGSGPEVCRQCGGRGQLRFQQGFFTVARTCGACRGAGKVITKPCTTCRGNGLVTQQRKLTVKIPAGIASGQRLRLAGEGEHGPRGTPGDLYVVVHVRDHEFFTRDGDDLHCELGVAFATLALGGRVDVPTLDESAHLDIPAGTQADTTFRLRGRGVPNISGRGRGDLYAVVKPRVPKKLSKEQKRLIEELAESLSDPPEKPDPDADRPFFERVKDIFG